MTPAEFEKWVAQVKRHVHRDAILRQARKVFAAQDATIAELRAKLAAAQGLQRDRAEACACREITVPDVVKRIRAAVARDFGVSDEELQLTRRRHARRIVIARHVFAWLLRALTSMTLREIGAEMGEAHHTTVSNATDVVEAERPFKGERWRRATRLLAILQADIAPDSAKATSGRPPQPAHKAGPKASVEAA